MKSCPNCNQITDDDNDFCPNDGTPLAAPGSTQPTLVFQTPAATSQPFRAHADLGDQRKHPGSQYIIFGLILLLSVVTVGFGVAYFSLSGKNDNERSAAVGYSNTGANDDKKLLAEKQNQIEAENIRLAEERKRLEADRKRLEAQKQSIGPLPPSSSAMIIDPPTNIRLTPNGKIQCVVGSRTVVPIAMSPGILDKNGVWYRTTACGTAGLVHSSQISFSY